MLSLVFNCCTNKDPSTKFDKLKKLPARIPLRTCFPDRKLKQLKYFKWHALNCSNVWAMLFGRHQVTNDAFVTTCQL